MQILAASLSVLLATSAVSTKGAVATAHPLASEAGASVLRRGGNAIDAAVAAAFALAVLEPASSGLGGGGFALVYLAREDRVHVLDFREVGPAKATAGMFLQDGKPRQDLSLDGPLSVAVPTAVKGYVELARRFGTRALSELVSPAQQLAARGFPVTVHHVRAVAERLDCLSADPEARRIFTVANPGDPTRRVAPQPGDRLQQPDLAKTLSRIGLQGDAAFYAGPVAKHIVDTVQKGGGVLSGEDLAHVRVRIREPMVGSYRGWKVVTMPPPSSGGMILLGLLQTLEGFAPRAGGYRPEAFLHAMIEAEKHLYARRELLGDPDFSPWVAPLVAETISKEYAASVRAQLGERAEPSEEIPRPRESVETTHVSVIDAEGNAVSLTTTVNYVFGSCVVAKDTGVLLNDQMDDFSIAPGVANAYGVRGGKANAPGSGKVPLSSMAPTLLFDLEGHLRLAIGSPGGSTIPTTVAQTILHFIDDGMTIDQAIAAPRLHHQLFPAAVRVEKNGLEAATQQALEVRGHTLKLTEPWGNAQGVSLDPKTGLREAASDPREGGAGAVP